MAAAEAALGAEAERDATRGDEGAAETTRLTEGSMATTRGPSMRRGGGGERRRGGPLGVRSRETDGRVVEVDVEVGLGRGGVFCVRGWRAVCQCQRAPGRRWKGFRWGRL